MAERLGRRAVLGRLGLAGAAVALGGWETAGAATARQRVLRIAHLTDTHVQPELAAGEGLTACLKHALGQKPDLILTGGDHVMDSFAATEARTRTQWRVWDTALAEAKAVPVRSCIGNHDVWGWDKRSSGTTGSEPRYGKKWAMEQLRLPRPYYSFDQAGWHFVALDSVYPRGESGYTARLDDAQFEWLKGDLASVPKTRPVLIWSHIPILAASAFMDGDNERTGDWLVPGAWMHTDARKLIHLFHQHPNVKLALSGHLHLRDRVEYNDVTYLCNGAVSGNWWRGRYHQTAEGYGVVDLFNDGTFEARYVTYGWQARA
jgi:3',5'-cyclic-AMP phosphodiesterase